MTGPRCWNCGSAQPPGATPGQRCVYCGAELGRPPMPAKVTWTAHRPAGVPGRRPATVRMPYAGPPTYRDRPRWGFAPSVWIPAQGEDRTQPAPPPPVRELRSARLFSRAAAVVCGLAAVGEGWRYALLVRGRTEVLHATEVRIDDALVVAAGWAALMLGVAAVIALVPAVGRAFDFAVHRAGVRSARTPASRLLRLLVPGWNLYGAGVIFAELDAVLTLAAPPRPAALTRAPLRWRTRELPSVPVGEARVRRIVPTAPAVDAVDDRPPPAVHRGPTALVNWWWLLWVVNGLVAAGVLVRTLVPGSLQVRADLVLWHVLLDLLAAALGLLTSLLIGRWLALMTPTVEVWPPGWVLQPASASQPLDHSTGNGDSPSPTTESSSSSPSLASTHSAVNDR